jgi:hypothetical protein
MTNNNHCYANYPSTYGKCDGHIVKHHFIWHVIPLPEMNEVIYNTILSFELCDNHYNMIVYSNNGKNPNTYGYNELVAIECLLKHCVI